MTIEGIQYTPDQSDSHAQLQERQGWKVSDMRVEIDSQATKIIGLSKELAMSESQIDRLRHQLALYEIKAHNALQFLELVNCGNVDQAKVACAISELKDVQRRSEGE